MLNAFLPLYGRDVLGLTTSELGWMFGLQTVTTLAVRPVIGFLSDRAGRRWVIVTGLSTCGAAMLVLSMATNVAGTVTVLSQTYRVGKRQRGLYLRLVLDTGRGQLTAYLNGRVRKRWLYQLLNN